MERQLTFILGITNCFLIPCEGGWLLVDTSYQAQEGAFYKKLADAGVKPEEIRWIFLTHHHDDHAGFLANLRKLTGARLIVHENAVKPLAMGMSQETMHPVNARIRVLFGLYRKLMHTSFGYPPVTVGPDDIVIHGDDAEILKTLGVAGRILCTPGHTDDSISLLLESGEAFVGDLAMNFLNGSGIHFRPIYVESIEQVFDGWRRLLAASATMLYVSHGKPVSAQKLKRRWKRELASVEAAAK